MKVGDSEVGIAISEEILEEIFTVATWSLREGGGGDFTKNGSQSSLWLGVSKLKIRIASDKKEEGKHKQRRRRRCRDSRQVLAEF